MTLMCILSHVLFRITVQIISFPFSFSKSTAVTYQNFLLSSGHNLRSSSLLCYMLTASHLKLEYFCSHGPGEKLSLEFQSFYFCTFYAEKALKQSNLIHSGTYRGFKILGMGYLKKKIVFLYLCRIQITKCAHRLLEQHWLIQIMFSTWLFIFCPLC